MEESKDKKTSTRKEVAVREYDEEMVPIVAYDDSIMSSSEETTIRKYLALHVKVYPEVADAIDDGVHTFEDCWSKVTEWVRKKRNTKGGCAMVSSDDVFRFVVNYYMSPVVEKEEEEKKAVTPVAQPSWDSPEARKAREEAEARHREEERRKKIEEDVKKNGALLFDFC